MPGLVGAMLVGLIGILTLVPGMSVAGAMTLGASFPRTFPQRTMVASSVEAAAVSVAPMLDLTLMVARICADVAGVTPEKRSR